MNKTIFILLLTFGIFGCKSPQLVAPEIQVWEVSENKMPCEGVAPQDCLQIRPQGSESWELFYDRIEGFNYREGYAYTIKVETTTVENSAADASAKAYKLITILSQKNTTDIVNGVPLVKGNYKVTSINGRNMEKEQLTLNFNALTKMINGFAGCNTYSLKFRQKGNLLRFSQVGKGRNYCEGKAQLEKEFLLTFVQGDNFELENGVLKVFNVKNQILEATLIN